RPGRHPTRLAVGPIHRHEDVYTEAVLVRAVRTQPAAVRPAALASDEDSFRFRRGSGCESGDEGIADPVVYVLAAEGRAYERVGREPATPGREGATMLERPVAHRSRADRRGRSLESNAEPRDSHRDREEQDESAARDERILQPRMRAPKPHSST